MPEKRIIGIDFGTSTSVVRAKNYNVTGEGENEKWMSQERDVTLARSITFNNGAVMVPTLVQKGEGKVNYGYDAAINRKGQTIYQNFKIDLEGENSEEARALTAEFIKYLYEQYKDQRDGGHIGNAEAEEKTIVSYPVKWSEATRQFMIQAAVDAGFRNVEGMDEAKAAITAVITLSQGMLEKKNYIQPGQSANIMLIDMGAGTTDIVISRYTHGEEPNNEILCTWPQGGEILFGGRELDEILSNYIIEKVPDDVKPVFAKRVKLNDYKAWKENNVSGSLRRNESVTTYAAGDNVLDILDSEMEPFELNRAEFERIAGDYLAKFAALVNGSLDECIKTGQIADKNDIDLIILTGGHSQWYFVHEMLSGAPIGVPDDKAVSLGKIMADPGRIIDIAKPQETVALGLAYSKLQIRVYNSGQNRAAVTADAPSPAPFPVPETSGVTADEEEEVFFADEPFDPETYQLPELSRYDRYIPYDMYAVPVSEYTAAIEKCNVRLGKSVEKYNSTLSAYSLYSPELKPTSRPDILVNVLGIPNGETILFLGDSSWFQRGANGIAITTYGIRYKESFGTLHALSWAELITRSMIKQKHLLSGGERIAEANVDGIADYLENLFRELRKTQAYQKINSIYRDSFINQLILHEKIEKSVTKKYGKYDGTPCVHPKFFAQKGNMQNYIYTHSKADKREFFVSDAGVYLCELFSDDTMKFRYSPLSKMRLNYATVKGAESDPLTDLMSCITDASKDHIIGEVSLLSSYLVNEIITRRKLIEQIIASSYLKGDERDN
ncbi:MAG: Hsp70 family protein [Ruminococcus sp.]|nr:Hsp70 family protein [Ruminococcus sp.]